MKKIITVVGARPQIIKASALSRAIRTKFAHKLEEKIIHTGQHYDDIMSSIFFTELSIPLPNHNLHVGSQNESSQTAAMMDGLEKYFIAEKPDAIVVYGDTTSTLACAIVSSKLQIPLIHIEAGLRSFDKKMPEEINRIMCDHASTLLFTPTISGKNNLQREGFELNQVKKASINSPKIYHSGDVMYDNSIYFSALSDQKSIVLEKNQLSENEYILSTIHRQGNTDDAKNLTGIFEGLLAVGELHKLPIVLPLHPRTKKMIELLLSAELKAEIHSSPYLKIIDPVGFLDMISLEKNSRIILTDSGGVQKEAFFFKKPAVILREQTEWVEIVEQGAGILAGTDKNRIVDATSTLLQATNLVFPAFYGDAKASEFICERILEDLA